MGRDVASIRIDKKANGSREKVNIRKVEVEEGSKVVETSPEKQETVGIKSTDHESGSSEIKSEPLKSNEKIISSPVSPAASGSASVEEHASPGLRISSNTANFHSPLNAKQSQRTSPFSGLRPQRSDTNKYHDEEDNWSIASSAATSRTVKSRVTVGVAPSFKSAQRAAQRKEFYTKLEQKHQALKAEKMEYEARTKEEQEEAIKQMRKSMVVKANPVPNFYRQGPPPKVELKKLPLTRAKSPKLSRRKSCGDSTHEEKALCSKVRHSIGTYKPTSASATSSPVKLTHPRSSNSKPKVNEIPKASPRKLPKETNSDITVHS